MIYAKHHRIPVKLFDYLIPIMINRSFASFCLYTTPFEDHNAILLIGNHHSWWDGFWAYRINQQMWKKRFYVMMNENNLIKHKLFNYAGAYSISKKSRNIIDSLNYSCQLLNNRETILVLYPQGRFTSHYDTQFKFGNGVEYLHNRCPMAHVVFYASFMDYGKSRQPHVCCYIEAMKTDTHASASIEHLYTQFYNTALLKHKQLFYE